MTAVCAILLVPAAANAASVSRQSGGVLISKGTGFYPITSPTELGAGGKVMVEAGGYASIIYANNCVVRVGAGIWLVQAAPPCADGTSTIDFTGRMGQQTQDPPPPIPPLLLGGLVAAGVGIAVLLNNGDKDKAASP
jgi:hypothetical protein